MTSLLIDGFLCGLVVIAELAMIFISLLFLQLIFYRIFKINLYKNFIKYTNIFFNNIEKLFYC